MATWADVGMYLVQTHPFLVILFFLTVFVGVPAIIKDAEAIIVVAVFWFWVMLFNFLLG